MFCLKLRRLVMNHGGARVDLRFVLVDGACFCVRCFPCLAVCRPLVRPCSGLALARTLFASSGLAREIWIVHTCRVPLGGTHNHPVDPSWPS
jgi:hypothetical protein